MIWLYLDCYIATNVCSRKSTTDFGDLPTQHVGGFENLRHKQAVSCRNV